MKFVFELKDHGVEHAQYWQGDGVANTPWTDVIVGCGDSAREAGEDALEQLFAIVNPAAIDVDTLLDINAKAVELSEVIDALPEDAASEVTHFVTIKWRWESGVQV